MSEKPYKSHITLDFSEDEIVEAIKRNDEKIIKYLVGKLVPDVGYTMRKWSATEEDVWDNNQNTWTEVIINIKTGKYKKGNFVGYFKKISKYIWLNSNRKKIPQIPISPIIDILPGETEYQIYQRMLTDERYLFIEECRKKLNDLYRKIIDMYYIKKMSHKQISEILGIEEVNARQKKYECLQKLRKCVRKLIKNNEG